MSRTTEREAWPDKIRIAQAEHDLDDVMAALAQVSARQTKFFFAVVGLLVSVTTAVLLFALQLATGH